MVDDDDPDAADRTFGSALDLDLMDTPRPASDSLRRSISSTDRARLDEIDRIVGARKLPIETLGARLDPDDDFPGVVPDEVPDYQIAQRLGRGGMGDVFEVRQTSLDRTVALKVYRRGEGTDDPNGEMRQFAREAVLTARLEHPNVVPVHALSKDPDGNLFFTMKKIEGVPWRTLLHPDAVSDPEAHAEAEARAGLMSWRDHVGILLKVMDAVAFAHSRGILHRDLKPANVMIGDYGEVYLMDWGLATPFGPDAGLEDHAQGADLKLAGTPRYMAPEMVRGELSRLSEATDVYLLGGVLFEIATGRMPRHGRDLRASLMMALSGRPEDPAEAPHPVHLTPALRAIIMKAMAPDMAQRHPSVTALRAEVQDYLAHADALTVIDGALAELGTLQLDLRPDDAPVAPQPPAQVAALYARLADIIARLRQGLETLPDQGEAKAGLVDAGILAAELAIAEGDLALAEVRIREIDQAARLDADPQFRALAHDAARHLRVIVAETRRRRADLARRARRLRWAAIGLGLVALVGVAFGALMLDARRGDADRSRARMFQAAVQGRADMIGQFIGDVERIAELYRQRAVELMDAPPPPPAPTPAGRPGFYLDADFADPATAPPDLAPLDGYDQPMSLRHPTIVRAPWVLGERIAAADRDAARLAHLGGLFGKVHRAWGRDLKWSLAGTRSGLLVGFPGSGRYADKPDYDPVQRPWYTAAIDAIDDAPIWGEPYVDASTGQILISCIARIRAGDPPETVGVVGVEVTLETVQRILLDFTRRAGSDIRALLVRPFAVRSGGDVRREMRVVIDTRARTEGDDWQKTVGMPLIGEVDPDLGAYVASLGADPDRPPMTLGPRVVTHARLDAHDWLLVVTALVGP